MKQTKAYIPRENLRLEVPDQVYKRLVRMLIQSVLQEEKPRTSNKSYMDAKEKGALKA